MGRKTPKSDDVKAGGNLRKFRMMRGKSQEWLGDQVGLTFQQIQKYEKGTNRMGASRLMQFCRILDVSIAQLVGEDKAATENSMYDYTQKMFTTHEGLDLAIAWDKLEGKPKLRRRIVDLVEELAT